MFPRKRTFTRKFPDLARYAFKICKLSFQTLSHAGSHRSGSAVSYFFSKQRNDFLSSLVCVCVCVCVLCSPDNNVYRFKYKVAPRPFHFLMFPISLEVNAQSEENFFSNALIATLSPFSPLLVYICDDDRLNSKAITFSVCKCRWRKNYCYGRIRRTAECLSGLAFLIFFFSSPYPIWIFTVEMGSLDMELSIILYCQQKNIHTHTLRHGVEASFSLSCSPSCIYLQEEGDFCE